MKNFYEMKPLNGKKAAIIGACGRIGLPLTYLVARAGYEVTAIDLNVDIPKLIMSDNEPFPYIESGLKDDLGDYDFKWKKVYQERVNFTTGYSNLFDMDYIVIIIGTPVDGENNPRVENIIKLFDQHIIPQFNNQTIILRSTVFPGMTDVLYKRIKDANIHLPDVGNSIVFAPERVSQGNSLRETSKLPQLIGAYSDEGFNRAVEFFLNLDVEKNIKLTPLEAEYGKLITNMYRYVNIAFANEVYMMTADKPVNIHKVIEAANLDYPRMNMPRPGPNAAGPCLFKDGKLLVDDTPYGDLINVAFHINEGMPKFIYNQGMKYAKEKNKEIKKVAIIGMTFKGGIDDTRFSASYKLKKILDRNGIEVIEYDRYLNKTDVEPVDMVFLMTPHSDAANTVKKFIEMSDKCIVVDAWKVTGFAWIENNNGVYQL